MVFGVCDHGVSVAANKIRGGSGQKLRLQLESHFDSGHSDANCFAAGRTYNQCNPQTISRLTRVSIALVALSLIEAANLDVANSKMPTIL